jgi:NTE family protein
MNITNLTFEGCGVLGCAEVGAASVLESKGILAGVTNVAGCSAGSIMSTLLACRYTCAQIDSIVNAADFSSFKDGSWTGIMSDISHYGLHPGNTFLSWLQLQIKNKLGNGLATFKDLKNTGGLNLVVFSCSLNKQTVKKFSFDTTPDVPICYAVRASMSIPGFFQAWQFPNSTDTDIYVDAGTVMNYPVTTFDLITEPYQTIGVCFDYGQGDDGLTFGHPEKYVIALVETALNAQNVMLKNDPYNLKRSCLINPLGISAINFDLTQAQKQSLFDSGVQAMTKFLS